MTSSWVYSTLSEKEQIKEFRPGMLCEIHPSVMTPERGMCVVGVDRYPGREAWEVLGGYRITGDRVNIEHGELLLIVKTVDNPHWVVALHSDKLILVLREALMETKLV